MKRAFLAVALATAACGHPAMPDARPAPAAPAHARAASPAVLEALRRAVVPVRALTAGHGFADLQPLKAAIGDATVVGLGEATHGTREFFTMKHRLLEWLVEEQGFTVFAIEDQWADMLAIDQWVRDGRGDLQALVVARMFTVWATPEVLDLVRWVRAYNLRHPDRPRVAVAGFDMQVVTPSVEALAAYCGRLGPLEAARVRAACAALRQHGEEGSNDYGRLPPHVRAAWRAAIADLLADLERRRAAYLAVSTPREHLEACQHARILAQNEAMVSSPDPYSNDAVNARDAAMATNVRWLATTAYPGAKVVLWGHNGHVTKAPAALRDGWAAMGTNLQAALGAGYYALGFDLHHGTALTRPWDGKGAIGDFQAMALQPARPGTLGATFAALAMPAAFLDMRPATGPLATWLHGPQGPRYIGAAMGPGPEDSHVYETWAPAAAYDGLIYIEESHATRPLEGT